MDNFTIIKYAWKINQLTSQMEPIMAWSNVADKFMKVVSSPIDLMMKWADEPLKNREHKRNIDAMTAEERFRNEQERANKSHEHKLKMEEEKHSTDQKIKRETEVARIISEIEDLRKDKQLERMKLATESLVKLQIELTKINTEAIASIGNLSLDLRNKAHNLLIEKKKEYEDMQEIAISKSMKRIEEIDVRFEGNERAKDMFYKAEDVKLSKLIDSTGQFITELSVDLNNINKNIDLLQISGQEFIKKHLSGFGSIGISQNDIKQLSENTDYNTTIDGTLIK